MSKYAVVIQKGDERKKILRQALEQIEKTIPNISGRIMIKPNFLSANNLLASTTPETLDVVVDFFRSRFPENEIWISEGAHVSEEYLHKYKIRELAEKYKVKVFSIDYDENDWKTIEFEDLAEQKCNARISNIYATADYIISLTVPKTHANIGLSLSMKNLVGIIHKEDRPKFHGLTENVPQEVKDKYKRQPYDRDDKIGYYLMKLRSLLPTTKKTAKDLNAGGRIVSKNLYNLYKNIQPNLCILDGFDGMQGNGPWHGENAYLRTVIIGNNPVATDLVACRVMGQPIQDIGYTNYIEDLEQYLEETEIIGNTIDEVKKKLKPHKFEPYLYMSEKGMERVVIAAASNIAHLEIGEKTSKSFLNGAAIYAAYASAIYNKTRVITCVGDEVENEEIIEKSKKYRLHQVPQLDVIKINEGKSSNQTFTEVNGEYVVTKKDYRNDDYWTPEIKPFSTDILLLGDDNPMFQKCVLDACTSANHILLDLKSMHLKTGQMDELLKKVNTFFGTQEEIKQLLENCELPITRTTELFNRYPNLRVIVEKNAGKGGRVFTSDGILYKYRIEQTSGEKCVDRADDVFAGVWAGMLSIREDLKSIIRKSAAMSAEAVRHVALEKIGIGAYVSPDIKIIIEESRWKERSGRDEKDTNRSN